MALSSNSCKLPGFSSFLVLLLLLFEKITCKSVPPSKDNLPAPFQEPVLLSSYLVWTWSDSTSSVTPRPASPPTTGQALGLTLRVPHTSQVSKLEHSALHCPLKFPELQTLNTQLPIKILGTDLPVLTGLRKFLAGC